ncbi:uncharacterized protein CcaverHIS019_0209950 [Cutaneotrichosporon cavernicola]|uniref:Dienelactone hydrolase domain-containing protein n=1 Tax=Cutaneotrichosporon cavernicola TaxID=279322 RepID=A0AA48L2M9_9TREE|nr:uncharacterized protein CcaverHIS019_0209950 [Cutaneotrichosporon cavernicola]BEI89633.1 hypothetical protein CcaverHIS019_0209950 [Cutaneotrichosporon cavernicola]
MASDTVCCPPQAPRPKVAHPVSQKSGYEAAGTYEKVGDFDKVYVTGPEKADHAVVVIYDIFGFWETSLRGWDLLANHLTLTIPHKLYAPDVFRGKPFPPERDGDKELLKKFFETTAKISDRLPEVIKFAQHLKKDYKTVSILGYCWGGKICLLSLATDTFHSGATCHPAMITDEDGDNLARPLGFYPSKDEPTEPVNYIAAKMKEKPFAKECDYVLYDTVHHGWVGARADLSDPENRKQFDAVYQRLADYFARVNA